MLCEAEGVNMHIFVYIHIPANMHPFISNSFLYQIIFLNSVYS